ncbi:MAG: hypothetical protein QG670_1560 [Thermoproteota archaeon]|nr:hypothetical protein [Thermoproteota archaeon]
MILIQNSASGDSDGEGGPDNTLAIYRYFYLVRVNVDGLENCLKANFISNWHNNCCKNQNFMRISRGTLADRPPRLQVGRRRTSQFLNADTDLPQILYAEDLDRLEVRPDKKRRYVRTEHLHWKTYSSKDANTFSGDVKNVYQHWWGGGTYLTTAGRRQFPTSDAFEAFERIAYVIRRIAMTSPLNSSSGRIRHG